MKNMCYLNVICQLNFHSTFPIQFLIENRAIFTQYIILMISPPSTPPRSPLQLPPIQLFAFFLSL